MKQSGKCRNALRQVSARVPQDVHDDVLHHIQNSAFVLALDTLAGWLVKHDISVTDPELAALEHAFWSLGLVDNQHIDALKKTGCKRLNRPPN